MNSSASANRFRLVAILSIAIAMAIASSWVALVVKKRGADAEQAVVRTEPDYFAENFSYVRMNPKGQPKYRLTGDKITHFPADDSFLVNRPVLLNISENGGRQTTTADRAVAVEDNAKVHLYDNVVVDRPPFGTTEAFHMTTDYLLVFPDDEIMQTPDPVVIDKGTSRLTGVGMFANNVTREMQIFGQTKVFFAPRNPGKQ